MANKWWHYWIPGYSQYLNFKEFIDTGNPFSGLIHSFGGKTQAEKLVESSGDPYTILGQVSDTSRHEFIEDRAHNEEREDTAYQRMVEDMRKAGLNPLMSGASPISPGSSSVGENTIGTNLQMLGYVLDLKNLDFKNRKLANDAIGNLIKLAK